VSGAKDRQGKIWGSLSDFANYATFGFTGMVNWAVNPKDPLSKEHLLDSFGVVTSVFGVKGTTSKTPSGGQTKPAPNPAPKPNQNPKKQDETRGTGKGDDFTKEPFLPDKYYKNNYVPDDGTPGARFDFSRLGSSGQIENSRVIYDQAGKQKFRIDYSDHGNSLHHTNPHMHEYIWQDGGKSAREIKYFVDPESGRLRKGKINIETNRIEFID
jgi:hypothetical protein